MNSLPLYFRHTSMGYFTFALTLIEITFLLYLFIQMYIRPDQKLIKYNIALFILLITYNLTDGFLHCGEGIGLPEWRIIVSYGAAFLTPCYFPYYAYKVFRLEKMEFHAKRGVFIFIAGAYVGFIMAYLLTGKVSVAQNILAVPFFYGIWICFSLVSSINYKYKNTVKHKKRKAFETLILLSSFIPWIGLTVVSYFNLGENMEGIVANPGFIILMGYILCQYIKLQKLEHIRRIFSHEHLQRWNLELKREVARKTDEIKKAHEEKINAFVHIAHETKTPLTLVNNYLEDYLERNIETEEIVAIKNSINKMVNDVNNLFDLEKSWMGKGLYDHHKISEISKILQNCLRMERVTCLRKKVELISETETGLQICADESAIRSIILNLLGNAIKYTDSGGSITVNLSTTENEEILLRVTDTGIGIEQAEIANIFVPYYQILQKKKASEGLGLGLPIVKKILEEIGATITIGDNITGEAGTTVEVKFKKIRDNENNSPNAVPNLTKELLNDLYETVSQEPLFSSGEAVETVGEKKYSVILIEDNIPLGKYLKKKLSTKYSIELFQKAEDVTDYLLTSETRPNLILSDMMLPGMDGATFSEWIMSNPEFDDLPVIFISANSTSQVIQRGLKSGAVDYMTKPFKVKDLLLKIDSLLVKREKCVRRIVDGACHNLLQLKGNIHTENTPGERPCPKAMYHLSDREMEIISLLQEGRTYAQIGEELFISTKTVGKHIENIYEKVGVNNKAALLNKLFLIKKAG